MGVSQGRENVRLWDVRQLALLALVPVSTGIGHGISVCPHGQQWRQQFRGYGSQLRTHEVRACPTVPPRCDVSEAAVS